MKKKQFKKKRKLVRERDWEQNYDQSFTHDRAKHRRAQTKLTERPDVDSPLPKDFTPNGRVVSHTKKYAFVLVEETLHLCLVDERITSPDATLLAPGDEVLVSFEADEAVVRGIVPRRTRLSRPASAQGKAKEQIIAANADLLVVVAAADSPPFRPGLVDRFLIAGEIGGVKPLLCINKMDLVESEPPELEAYRKLGIPVVCTSCETGEGIQALGEALAGQLSVVAGHSGVGKSSLLHALDPELRVITQPVSESTNRGRHTTTNARLYRLHGGTDIIDTPGIRALGLWQVAPEELTGFFPDLAEVAAHCKFRDCTHIHEPDCGVLAAVASGTVQPERYASYLRIRASLESETGMTPGRMTAKYQGDKSSG